MDKMENQLPPLPPSVAVDEAYINGMYLGLSFRSLLTYGSPPSPVLYSSSSFDEILKTPKCEPLFSDESPPYNFFSGETPPHNFFSGSSSSHHKTPNLVTLELPPPHAAVDTPSAPPKKRQRASLISHKIRALQKLLPCEKKMCMATVLEETYKYVKFLQAQVSVLRSMPEKSSGAVDYGCGGGGGLAGVGRAELLQVMVNSPAVQAVLCADGCCVYSSEQVEVMKEIAERNAAFDRQMMVFDNAHSALYYSLQECSHLARSKSVAKGQIR